MLFIIVTLFPEMFDALKFGVVGRAIERGLLQLQFVNPRDFTKNKYKKVDDTSYGGGPGMVMMAQPLCDALKHARELAPKPTKVILLSPQGKTLQQQVVQAFLPLKSLILVAGRYEGIDERVMSLIDEEWSIGDYVVSGGELPAMVLIDAIVRLIPGVLGDMNSVVTESFNEALLDHPHYTKPPVINGQKVPDVLLSGDHKLIARWRRQQMLGRTYLRRPELLKRKELTKADQLLLDEFLQKAADAKK